MSALMLSLAALFAAFGTGGPDEVTGPPIVFAAIPDPTPRRGPDCHNRGDPEIFTVAPDGSDLTRVTYNLLHEYTPAWSPDHSHIVFAARPPLDRDPAADEDLFVMRADGTRVRRLTDGPKTDSAPAWSPDGKRIAFRREFPRGYAKNEQLAMMVVRADGSGLRRLTPRRQLVFGLVPRWSPDGSRIVFHRDLIPGPVSQLRISAPGKRHRTVVQDRVWMLGYPDWSPDGRWLVYTSHRSTSHLERVRVDGSSRRALMPETWGWADNPAWSPRGNRIAFAGSRDECMSHVHRMSADGDLLRDLLKGRDLEVYSLDW